MLLILWMMLMHTALPHVHHEHEEHSHYGSLDSHTQDHHGEAESKHAESDSIFDLFFQNHTHTNHLPQSISVDQEKSDLVKQEQRKIVQAAVFSSKSPPVSEEINSEKLKSRGNPLLKSPFFNSRSLRGPPVLG